MEELGGVREVARWLGISRQRVYQLVVTDPRFPEPVAELEMGRIWRMADIDKWRQPREPAHEASPDQPAWVDMRSDQLMDLLASAQDLVRGLRHRLVRLEHLVIAMLDDDTSLAFAALAEAGVTGPRARRYLKQLRATPESSPLPPDVQRDIDVRPFAPELFAALEASAELVADLGLPFIRTDHILLVMAETPHNTGWDMLGALGVELPSLAGQLRERATASSDETKTRSYRSERVAIPGGSVIHTTPLPPGSPSLDLARKPSIEALVTGLAEEIRHLRSEVAELKRSS